MRKLKYLCLILCLFISGCTHEMSTSDLPYPENEIIQNDVKDSEKSKDTNQIDDQEIEENKNDETENLNQDDVSQDIITLDPITEPVIDSDGDVKEPNYVIVDEHEDVNENTELNINTELTTPSYDPQLDEDKLLDPDKIVLPQPGLLGPDQLDENEITFVHTRNKFEDVVFDDTINVYVFWGNRCAHCTHLIEYLESLLEDEPDLFKLYTFEVWHDEENKAWLDELALITEEEVEGVPYMIIGDDVFVGYDPILDEDIYDSITDRHRHDIILEWSEDK